MKLKFTRSALRDLTRLHDFIARKNPTAAKRVSQQLKRSITRIFDHPELGSKVDELVGVRDLVSADYVVRYLVLAQEIIILRVWHGRENR